MRPARIRLGAPHGCSDDVGGNTPATDVSLVGVRPSLRAWANPRPPQTDRFVADRGQHSLAFPSEPGSASVIQRLRSDVPGAVAGRFTVAVPSARVEEVDADHYVITTHDDSIAAIGTFLRTS